MSILITILLVIAALVVLVLLIALFAKKSYSVKREITINKPRQDVFNYVKYLKNQDHFNKWVMMDPTMKKEFRGTDGTVGFVYAWEGNKRAGKGEQEIMGLKEGERVDSEIRFVKPFAAVADSPFVLESTNNNQTLLKWGMTSTMKYPMNFMLAFMNMDKLLGKDLEESMNRLKNILEKN